jgi:hypothetical protein
MAENKDSSMELESELENMGDLGMELDLDNDVTADMVELKNRMDKADQEMRAMTEAMKSTLLDVRTLMQDMDNPFNMLRDMGVDKLVNVAVESVEDEVNKQKREEAKKRLAGNEDNEKSPVVVSAGASAAPSPSVQASPNYPAPSPSVQASSDYSGLSSGGGSQVEAPVVQDIPQTASTHSKVVSQPVSSGRPVQALPSTKNPVELISGGSQDLSYVDERMAQTEEAVTQIAGTVNELAKAVRESNRRRPSIQSSILASTGGYAETSDYYEAYVSLIADYLRIRLGEKDSEELLLEGMYKEWASPKVVRDIMDKLSSSKKKGKKNASPLGGLSDVEDKMLITSLLRNLDRPVSEWGESTHLFMLLALVSRARENQVNRS